MPDNGRLKKSIIELSGEKYRDENGAPLKFNRFKRPDKQYQFEQIDDINVADTGGHISTKTRVEQLLLAGKNLKLWRKATYDFESAEDVENEFFLDPTRAQNYDLADASQYMLKMEIKRRKMQEELENDEFSNTDGDTDIGGNNTGDNPSETPQADPA